MFLHPISTTDVVSAALASTPSYAYSDEIDLRRKYFDDKNLALICNITTNNASGILDVISAIGHTSGGTFATFITASGSSKLITSGTSATGLASDGAYFIPLMIVPVSGLTIPLRAAPIIKFGFICRQADIGVSAFLAIG